MKTLDHRKKSKEELENRMIDKRGTETYFLHSQQIRRTKRHYPRQEILMGAVDKALTEVMITT